MVIVIKPGLNIRIFTYFHSWSLVITKFIYSSSASVVSTRWYLFIKSDYSYGNINNCQSNFNCHYSVELQSIVNISLFYNVYKTGCPLTPVAMTGMLSDIESWEKCWIPWKNVLITNIWSVYVIVTGSWIPSFFTTLSIY